MKDCYDEILSTFLANDWMTKSIDAAEWELGCKRCNHREKCEVPEKAVAEINRRYAK